MQITGMEQNAQQQENLLLDYGTIIWRRKKLLIALISVSVVVTMAVSLILPKYYKSEAMILAIAPEAGGLSAVLSAGPLAAALTGPLGTLSSPADKILVFLKSRTIAEMIIKHFDLLRVFNANKWDDVKGTWKDPKNPPLMEEAVKMLGQKVTTFRKSKEGAITITIEWKDAKLAAQIANYYVFALAEFMKDKSVNTTVQVVDPAVPAEKKSSPRIGLNMAMAGIVSLFFGVFVVLLLERLSLQKRL